MLELLMGRDWTTVRDEILKRIAADVAAGQGGRILLVPELISHDMERRLCAAAGDTASRYAQVLSFTRLARRVAEAMGSAAEECLDNGGRVVAMAAAARQLHSKLKAYASVETKPEFLTGLVDAVDEFKRCCISAEDLMAASVRTEGGFSQKLEELALILDAYNAVCAQGRRDPRDQMTWALEQMELTDYGKDLTVYIDGFPDFTRQHLAVIAHLIRVCPNVVIGLNADKVDSGTLAFEKAGKTASDLIHCAKKTGQRVKLTIVEPADRALLPMLDGLFQGKTAPVPGVRVFHGDSAYNECVETAERILELVRQGCRYRDIAVVCADMNSYRSVLELVFHRCRIPIYLAGTEDVLQKSVVSAMLAALDAALGGFEQADVLRYLHSVLSPLEQDLCDRVENYAILWGVRGSRWLNPWENHPDGLSGQWSDESRAEILLLEEARHRAVAPLQKLHQGFRAARNLAQQTAALYAFLEDIGLADQLDRMARQMEAGGDPRSAQILSQLWEILVSALEQLHDVLGATAWDDDVFTRLLALLLGQYDVGTIPAVLDAVSAGPVSAMRCQQAKHLFVLGAQEGSLPGYGGSSGILTDQERTALRQMDIPLTGGAMEGLQAEFAEIFGVFCGASETVTVSCASANPSLVYRRLRDMSPGEEEATAVLGHALADPWEAGAYLARWRDADTAHDLGVMEGYREALDRGSYTLGKVSGANIRKLYGKQLNLSASQVDAQAGCRLSYFLKYGLRAKERKEQTVDPAEFGTYVHAVLEETAREVMGLGGFREVSLEDTLVIAHKYSEQYAREHFAALDSRRLEYLFARNGEELEMIVRDLWEELRRAEFAPADFEVHFGGDGLAPIRIDGAAMAAVLNGFIDRVDAWHTAGNDYFRVVDYKTGKKDFDLCDVYNGVGLQMLLYLFALEKSGESVVGKNPIPVGVQYFPARSPLLSADGRVSDEEAEKKRDKESKRRGMLLDDEALLDAMGGNRGADLADREQLRLLEKYIFIVLRRMVNDIASGNVNANPYSRGSSHDTCRFCRYSEICRKNEVVDRRNYKTMTDKRFWEDVAKEVDHG